MVNKKISQLNDGGGVQTGDQFVIVRGGSNYRANASTLRKNNISIEYSDEDYVLSGDDAGRLLELNKSVDIDLVIPDYSGAGIQVGFEIDIIQLGIGKINIVSESSVIVYSAASFTSAFQYARLKLYMRDENEWVLTGDLEITS